MEASKMIPDGFIRLKEEKVITDTDITMTDDGFFAIKKSVSDMLMQKGINDFSDDCGNVYACDRFFDDWHFYAVTREGQTVYSLFKLREQEFDFLEDIPADGDTPGVTVSFIAFDLQVFFECIWNSESKNRIKLSDEIGRVVSNRGQRHNNTLKNYFVDPKSKASYLVAAMYVNHLASFSREGTLDTPEHYKEIVKQLKAGKRAEKLSRITAFIDDLNQRAGRVVCDHQRIYIADAERPDRYEAAALLATHCGNTSVYSFAAEVEYHARFLMRAARIRVPFFGISIYESAIRADMTIDDNEFEGPSPFYKEDSNIVKRQKELHREWRYLAD